MPDNQIICMQIANNLNYSQILNRKLIVLWRLFGWADDMGHIYVLIEGAEPHASGANAITPRFNRSIIPIVSCWVDQNGSRGLRLGLRNTYDISRRRSRLRLNGFASRQK